MWNYVVSPGPDKYSVILLKIIIDDGNYLIAQPLEMIQNLNKINLKSNPVSFKK